MVLPSPPSFTVVPGKWWSHHLLLRGSAFSSSSSSSLWAVLRWVVTLSHPCLVWCCFSSWVGCFLLPSVACCCFSLLLLFFWVVCSPSSSEWCCVCLSLWNSFVYINIHIQHFLLFFLLSKKEEKATPKREQHHHTEEGRGQQRRPEGKGKPSCFGQGAALSSPALGKWNL